MAEPEEIADRVAGRCSTGVRPQTEPLAGQHVLVTAGGPGSRSTAVRFLGNRSSGRMGVALAEAASERGARVTLLAANLHVAAPDGVDVVATPTAADLRREALARADADVVLMAAAVADYRPAEALDGEAAEGRGAVDDRSRADRRRRPGARRQRGATARCSSPSGPRAGRGRSRPQADDADGQERRPRRLQRRGARRHRVRQPRQRGRARLARGRTHCRQGLEAGDRAARSSTRSSASSTVTERDERALGRVERFPPSLRPRLTASAGSTT